jgi:orotate phosphoribosyltransferase
MVTASVPSLEPTILSYLKQDGLLREGHFSYRSGNHSSALIDRDRLLSDTHAASQMGYALSRIFFGNKVDTVASPSIWGAGLAQWVAYFLEPRAKVIYATPLGNGERTIAAKLQPLIEGKRILLVDNVIISGETMLSLQADIERLGGEVVGMTSLWDGVADDPAGIAPISLFNRLYPAYPADACPLCAAGDTSPEDVSY